MSFDQRAPGRGFYQKYCQDKPPKIRFRPGTFLRYKGQLYEVLYAYRYRDDSREWHYTLEERTELRSVPSDPFSQLLSQVLVDEGKPRVSYELFRDWLDAERNWNYIPAYGDRVTVSNKKLMQFAEVVSSGEVL